MEKLSKVIENSCERIILFNTGVEFIMKEGSDVENVVISDSKIIVDGEILPDDKEYMEIRKIVLGYFENPTINKLTANIDDYRFLIVIDTPLNTNKVVTDDDLAKQIVNVIGIINDASRGRAGAFGCKSTCKRVHTDINGLYIDLIEDNVVNRVGVIMNSYSQKFETEMVNAKMNGFNFNKYLTLGEMVVGYWG